MHNIILKPGRDKSLRRWHPWIFSGAVLRVEGTPQAGGSVTIRSDSGEFLALAAYSPHSQIRARVWSFDKSETIAAPFFKNRLLSAIALRHSLGYLWDKDTACRLVNAESDRLPGVIVDRYGDYLVCQFLSTGAEYWKQTIVDELDACLRPLGIYERSDTEARHKEGLPTSIGSLRGQEPITPVEINECGRRYLVDIRHGHKTGFYLDQRNNRTLVASHVHQADVLNCFCYTGGFGVAAIQGKARSVINIDSSRPSLDLAKENCNLNNPNGTVVDFVEGDVFQILRDYLREGKSFDCIVLDPPKFVDSAKNLNRAARGYKDINRLAFHLLRPKGSLFTFSCSGLIETSLFQKIVADAALDANRHAQIIQRLDQAEDHPLALEFPEGTYLKGLRCQVAEN